MILALSSLSFIFSITRNDLWKGSEVEEGLTATDAGEAPDSPGGGADMRSVQASVSIQAARLQPSACGTGSADGIHVKRPRTASQSPR